MKISDYTIESICSTFGVRKEWLLSGQGDIYFSKETEDNMEEVKRKKNSVGSRIRQLRKNRNMTQAEFAAMVGYSTVQIYSVECGGGASVEFLHNVAGVCGNSEQWLIEGTSKMNDCVLDEMLLQCLRSNPDIVQELMERFGLE